MAGLVSNLLLLTIQFAIMGCTRRTTKMVYKPYGPKMCRQLCEDLGGNFFFAPEGLSCHRVPTNEPAGSITDSPKHCLMEVRRTSDVPAFSVKTELSACSNHHADGFHPNPQQLTTGATGDVDLRLGQISHNISLHQACEDGNMCVVQLILSQSPADINTRDKLGRTPVMAAVMKNQVAVFDFLTSKSCDLTAVDNNNDTVLHVACVVGNVVIVRKLVVNHTCDTESRGGMGMTPVLKSALSGHRGVVGLLIGKGCNVKALDDSMNNILHVACSGGHVDMVKYVLKTLHSELESRGEQGRTPVMIAAHSGHTDVFDFLASQGSDLLAVDDNNDNILHVACIGGHVDMVQHILTKTSVDIESKAKQGRTPVMKAAQYGRRSVVDFLVSKHCNLKTIDEDRNTLLHVACIGGRLAMVKHILQNLKFPMDSQGQDGQTPVMTAARHGHEDVVKYLVSKGCNLTILNIQQSNILHVACRYGHVGIVKYILTQTNISIDSRGYIGQTPVMYAAGFGQKSVCMYLVNQGCKVMILDKYKNTILHLACIGGSLDVVKYILSRTKIGIDIRGQYGRTPVMTAAYHGHMSLLKYLKAKGCKLSTTDLNGDSILHLACMGGSLDVVKYILSRTKIGIDIRGQYGRTPVMVAAYHGHMSLLKYLISKGCKLSTIDLNGDSILHLACMGGSLDVVKYILSRTKIGIDIRGQYGRTPVMTAAYHGHMSLFEYLKAKGCKLSTIDLNGDSILHLACMGGSLDVVKYILSRTKIGIDIRGQYGRTPVMTAAYHGHMSLFEYLKAKGCKLSTTDLNGDSILHMACVGGSLDVVKYILSNTRNAVDRRGQYGRTPVMYAAYYGRTSVVKYIVRKGCKLTKVDDKGTNVLEMACVGRHEEVVKYLIKIKSWSKTCSNGSYG